MQLSENLSNFQKKCYIALLKVPAGKVITYSGLAKLIGMPKAARAVGSAMRKNPYYPKIPCHRVIKIDGKIGQYVAGIDKKVSLLKSEGITIKNNCIPNLNQFLYK